SKKENGATTKKDFSKDNKGLPSELKEIRKRYIRGELTKEEHQDCFQKGFFKKGELLDKGSVAYIQAKHHVERMGNGYMTGDQKSSKEKKDQQTDSINLVTSSYTKEEDMVHNIIDKDTQEEQVWDTKMHNEYFTAHEVALMNFEDQYGDYNLGVIPEDELPASNFSGINQLSKDGVVNTAAHEAFLDSGTTIHLIDKPSKLIDRRIVKVEEARTVKHQGKELVLRIVGKVKIGNINGKDILINDVWVYNDLPNFTLSMNRLRDDNSQFTVFATNKDTFVALKRSNEEIKNNQDQVVFKTRRDPVSCLEYLNLADYEMRPPGWVNEYMNSFDFEKKNTDSINSIDGTRSSIIRAKITALHKIGHINYGEILESIKQGIVRYETLSPEDVSGFKSKDFICEECDQSKIINASFKTSTHPVSAIGDRIHLDLHGPIAISRNGYQYFAIYVDEYSGYVWTVPLKSKSDASKASIILINLISHQFNPVKSIRTDHGTEFNKLNEFCVNTGIDHECSVVYAHQQNGRAERMIRHITTLCRSILLESLAPVELWREALRLATHVTNMQYIRHIAGEKKTAFEALYRRKPDMTRFHPFGVDCVAFIPIERQNKVITENHGSEYGKFAPRGHKAIYLGEAPLFTGNTDEYRSQQGSIVYNIETNQVQVVLKVISHNNTYRNLQHYKSVQQSKHTITPGKVYDILTLNDFVDNPHYISPDPRQIYEFENYTQADLADNSNTITPSSTTSISTNNNSTPTSNVYNENTQQSSTMDSSPRQTRSSTGAVKRVRYSESDDEEEPPVKHQEEAMVSHQEESPTSQSSTHQEEDLVEDEQPMEWSTEDMKKANDYMKNSDEVNSSFLDLEKKVLQQFNKKKHQSMKKGVGRVGINKRRFKKDDIILNKPFVNKKNILATGDSINAAIVSELKLRTNDIKVPNTLFEALNSKYVEFWEEAMKVEMDAQLENKVFSEINRDSIDPDCNIIDTRWVFALKTDNDGYVNRFKARLVARGFTQVEGKDYNNIYAPVVGVEDIRLLCGLATIQKMKMVTFDVKTAFLNAPIDLDLYIKMPRGTKDYSSNGKPKVYKVLQALYGLKQAPKQWYDMFTSYVQDIGFNPCTFSNNIFTKGSGENQVILAIYVDDTMVMSSNQDALDKVIKDITTKFKTDDPGHINKFLGLNIHQTKDLSKVFISGNEYIDKTAEKLNLKNCYSSKVPMATSVELDNPRKDEDRRLLSAEEHSKYRSLVGSLRYLTTVLRVDISNSVRRLSHYLASPWLHHWKLAIQLFGYVLKTKDYCLKFEVGCDRDKHLVAYSDASFAVPDEKKSSVSGGVIFFSGAPIHWFSQRQNIANKSTMDSELIALELVTAKVSRIRNLLKDLDYAVPKATNTYEDNQALCLSLPGEEPYKGHSNLCKKFVNVRASMNDGIITVKQVSTTEQLADCLTKSFPAEKMKSIVKHFHCSSAIGGVLAFT
ncbi:MAG: DDE-type integrase/transposase/recombinase, partial [Atopostipes sp.]|nr:DDE-type integrase/transposase/recombinase [Atopostipes sp.]